MLWKGDYTSSVTDIGSGATMTLTEETGLNAQIIIASGTTVNNLVFKPMISYEKDTDYIEHQSKEYTLQTQQKMLQGDYFDIANKKEVHKWIELVLDEENINKLRQNVTITKDLYRYVYHFQNEKLKTCDTSHAKAYCTHFKLLESEGTWYAKKGFVTTNQNGYSYVYIYDEGEMLEEFKAKITDKEIKFYLQLEEPIMINCTDEQIAVLNELENMTTYNDKTIITLDNDLSEMTVEVEQSRMSILEEKIKKEETV